MRHDPAHPQRPTDTGRGDRRRAAVVRGLLDVFVPGFDVQSAYVGILLGAAVLLLGIRDRTLR